MVTRCTRIPVVLLAVLGLGACRIEPMQRSERINPDDVAREDISTVLDAYRDALLRGDAAAVAAAFTPDARLFQPDSPEFTGTDEIRRGMQRLFAGFSVSDLLLEREQVDIAGGVAFEMGTFEETIVRADSSTLELRGRYAIRWRRGPQAEWRMERMLINHYPPADSVSER